MALQRGKTVGLVLLAACATACFSDLDGVKIDRDGGGLGDGGGGGSEDLAGGGGGSCELPYLLVMVRDLRSTSGLERHGMILRVPLDGRDPCTPLTLNDSLDPDATAIGFWPPSTVVYGQSDGRVRFLALDDTEAQAPYDPGSTQSPDYIFSLLDESNVSHLAIGYDRRHDPEAPDVERVDVLNATNLAALEVSWQMGISDKSQLLRVEGVVGVDADPHDAHRLIVFRSSPPDDPTQWMAAPWDGQSSLPVDFLDSQDPDDVPRLMRTLRDGSSDRYVWMFAPPGFTSGDQRLVHRLVPSTGPAKQWGPLACVNATLCTEPMQFSDAIPDPTDDDAVITTCYVESSPVTNQSTANVIRMHGNGQCETLFRGDTLPELHHLLGLAVAR